MSFDPDRPYNDLPPLPPQGVPLETVPVLKQVVAASRELAELKGAGNVIPNQHILLSGVVLQEARLSSEIENIVTTNDELYQASADDLFSASPHTKEVLRYQQALWGGFEKLRERPLSTNLFIELVEIIKGRGMGIRRLPGTKLTGNDGRIVYTPPEGEERLRALLGNLEQFVHDDESGLDPLIRLAVMHYQFEAIHPFGDGNGRTGRVINILYLVERGLLELPVLYLSRYIIRNKPDYYEGLRRVTEEQAWEDWILFMLRGIEEMARETRELIRQIADLMVETGEIARIKAPKAYSKDLIELIFEQPYCKIRFLEERGLAKRQTASTYLKAFAGVGLLRPVKAGREVYYINDRLLRVLAG
ncbi:Fic family protein [Thiolapillus sp.]